MNFIQYLETISGISIYPMISLLVFVIFFIILFYMVMKMDKNGVDILKNLPINDEVKSNSIVSQKNK